MEKFDEYILEREEEELDEEIFNEKFIKHLIAYKNAETIDEKLDVIMEIMLLFAGYIFDDESDNDDNED